MEEHDLENAEDREDSLGQVAEDGSQSSPHELGSRRFLRGGAAPGERERFCETVGDGEVREAFSASRLATPSWIAFLRESESVLRLLGAEGTKAGEDLVVSFDEKSRLTVARPERGCRSSCIVVSKR